MPFTRDELINAARALAKIGKIDTDGMSDDSLAAMLGFHLPTARPDGPLQGGRVDGFIPDDIAPTSRQPS